MTKQSNSIMTTIQNIRLRRQMLHYADNTLLYNTNSDFKNAFQDQSFLKDVSDFSEDRDILMVIKTDIFASF